MPNCSSPKFYLYDGKELLVKEIASKAGIPASTLYQLINRHGVSPGGNLTKLIEGSQRKNRSGRTPRTKSLSSLSGPTPDEKLKRMNETTFTYQDKPHSIDELVEVSGYPLPALYHILQRHDLSTECFELISSYKRNRSKLFIYNGDILTLKEVGTWVNKSPEHLAGRLWHARIEQGEDITDIANAKPKSRRTYLYGAEHLTMKQLSMKTLINYTTLRDYIREEGCTHGDDVTKAIRKFMRRSIGPSSVTKRKLN